MKDIINKISAEIELGYLEIKVTKSLKNCGRKVSGLYHRNERKIEISAALKGNKQIACLLHEIGHHLHFEQGFSKSNTSLSDLEKLADNNAVFLGKLIGFDYTKFSALF